MVRTVRGVCLVDVLVAVLFGALAILECTFVVEYGPSWPYLLNALIHLGLVPAMLWRRRRPVLAFVAAYALLAGLAGLVAVSPVNLGVSPALFAAPLAVLAITRHGPSPWWGYAALVLGILGSFASPLRRLGGWTGIGVVLHVLMIVGCYLWSAQQRQLAQRYARDLAEQERTHAEQAARAVEAERTGIAREVHDIVAHHLAVVRVQASTALAIGGEEPMRAALSTIKDLTGEALAETRELVDALRENDPSGPSGDLTSLPVAVDRARAARPGLQADLSEADLADWQRSWSAQTRLTVLRVAQEALTNMVRHGDGSAVFDVREEPGQVLVEALDEARREATSGGGHGLVGVRERVALAGGTMEAGPVGPGYRLVARIPVRRQP